MPATALTALTTAAHALDEGGVVDLTLATAISAARDEALAAARAEIEALARGSYQRSLAEGSARWSGADLAGAARRWGGRYRASREALHARIRGWASAAGATVGLDGGTAQAGPFVLVISHPSGWEIRIGGR